MTSAKLWKGNKILIPTVIVKHLGVSVGGVIEFVVEKPGEVRLRIGQSALAALRGLLRQERRDPVSIAQMDAVNRKAARS